MKRRTAIAWLPGLAALHASASSLPDLIDATAPSVVGVGTFDRLKSPRFRFRGTGFVAAEGNRVVTNAHVLPKTDGDDAGAQLAVMVSRPRSGPELRLAKVLATDPDHDVAVLAADGPPIPPLKLAADTAVRAGTAVALVGFPLGTVLGLVPVTHRGIVAAVTSIALPSPTAGRLDSRTLARLREGSFDVFQLDATAYPGNSGSPLIELDTGAVIGVINMVYVKATKESAIAQPTGITYAIPVRWVRQLLDRP